MSCNPEEKSISSSTSLVSQYSPTSQKHLRKILVPVENASLTALNFVLENLAKPQDLLVLVNVRESPVDEMLAWEAAIIPEDHLDELETKMKAESKEILESLLKQALSTRKDLFIDCLSIRGDPRHELIVAVMR